MATATAAASSSSSASSNWPSYMNPDNGAIFPPTTTYTPTYMDPNNGAIYPSVTSSGPYQSGNYAGSVSETIAVGEAFSIVITNSDSQSSSVPPSGFNDWDSYGSYTAGLAGSNGTMTGNNNSTSDESASAPTGSEASGGAGASIKIVTVAVPGVVALALIILGVWFCCRCRRRRRAKRTQREEGGQNGGGEGRYGQMREIERGGPVSATSRHPPASLTRDEVLGVVSPRTQQHYHHHHQQQQQHRIDLIYPSRPQAAASTQGESGRYNQLASPAGTFGNGNGNGDRNAFPRRAPSSHVGSSRHSRWTDDSEFDVMAEDGSTITRTISTTSTRRTIRDEEMSTPVVDENPFDHPAYTYRAATQRSGALSRGNTLTRGSPVGTWSSSHPSSNLHSTLSPISPVTPMTTSFPSSPAPSYLQPQHHPSGSGQRNDADNYSIHSSEDGIFGPSASASATANASASASLSLPVRSHGIRREPTIIRHADSSAQGLGRYSTKVERAGRDDAGVVELPPLYEDATSSWTR